jgi:hypothetical protein
MNGSGNAGGAAHEAAARPTARVDLVCRFLLQTRDGPLVYGTDCLTLKGCLMSARLGRHGLVDCGTS